MADTLQSKTVLAAQKFLDVIWTGTSPTETELQEVVDNLISAYHNTPSAKFTDMYKEAPDEDWNVVWNETGKRFPKLGFYSTVDPLKLGDQDALMTGDAIDDIADITKDMRQVIWYTENVHIDDAHACFREMYYHWGQHARDLSCYLFARSKDEL